jgi:hypothetical protein
LYPKHKKVIFAKIAHFDDFPFSIGKKPEADIPEHQEQGRILNPKGCMSQCFFTPHPLTVVNNS